MLKHYNNNRKFIERIIPFFLIISVSIFMFWDINENFLVPNTFNLLGDAGFPLSKNYINIFSYSWDSRGENGLGFINYNQSSFLIYFLAWLWSVLGVPLWIANRLWHIMPNMLIGLAAFYLYRSLFNNKYSWICGTIASIFILLLPDRNIFPFGNIGFAGALFIIGAFVRGSFSEYLCISKKNSISIFSIGILMSKYYPRCFYIAFLTIGILFILRLLSCRRNSKDYLQIFKFYRFFLVVAFLVNLHWIIPLYQQLSQGLEHLLPNENIVMVRKIFTRIHQDMTNPLYIIRLTTGGPGLGRPADFYFSHILILPFTFLVPIFCYLPLVLRNIARRIRILSLFSVFFSFYPVSFNLMPSFNMFLRNHIPVFWIMNDPSYWLLFSGACYGLVMGSMTEYFLGFMNKRAGKIIFISIVSIIIVIFGGGVLLDRPLLPGFPTGSYTLYGNKAPYVKFPEAYNELERYLYKNAKNSDRVWYIDMSGFKQYTWAYKYHMPEILFFKSPITTVGRGMSFNSLMIDLLSDSVDYKKQYVEKTLDLVCLLGKILNIKYIVIHKDYYSQEDKNLNNYIRKKIAEDNRFRRLMDTDSLVLYENIDPFINQIYAVRGADLIIEKPDIDVFSLIKEVGECRKNPLYIFTEQMQYKDIKNIRIGIDKIIFNGNCPHNLKTAKEILKKMKRDNKFLENKKSKVILYDGFDEKYKIICWDLTQKDMETLYFGGDSIDFDIPQEDDYIIESKVQLDTEVRHIKDIGSEFKFEAEKDLRNWSFSQRRVRYYYLFTEKEGLCVFLYFDGNQTEDEFVQMQNKSVNIDLKKYPFFDLIYKVENPIVQTIEIVAGVDFDGDGLVNEYFRGLYPAPASRTWNKYSRNIYKIARKGFPDKMFYNLVFLEIYPHKIWGVDCSGPKKKGEYKFWIKKLKFYGLFEGKSFRTIEDALNLKIDSPGEINSWTFKYKKEDNFFEVRDKSLVFTVTMPQLEIYRTFDKVDLKKFTLIKLEYSSLNKFKLILGIDHNGDGIADNDISCGALPPSKDFNIFYINAYKMLKSYFPDETEYNLAKIKLQLSDSNLDYKKRLCIKRIQVFSSRLESSVHFDKPVFELDNTKYRLNKTINIEEIDNLFFEQIVHLGKGRHKFKKLHGLDFKVEKAILKPKTGTEELELNEPEISFTKVNPSKYKVHVTNATEPFWLVLSESYHKDWEVYLQDSPSKKDSQKIDIKESEATVRFTPDDIKFLFKKPLNLKHHLVNGYANGWYIDPKNLNLKEDFILEIYFRPQSQYYIYLGVSGLTILIILGSFGIGSLVKRGHEK